MCSKKHHPKKGEKTDFRDAIQLAHLHRHGMLTGSYLPERGIVETRDLTRRRKKLLGNLASLDFHDTNKLGDPPALPGRQ